MKWDAFSAIVALGAVGALAWLLFGSQARAATPAEEGDTIPGVGTVTHDPTALEIIKAQQGTP